MLNKSIIALSALLIVGGASSAFAYEEPEHRLGDRYSFLVKVDRPAPTGRVATRNAAVRQAAKLDLYTNEVPEHIIGDRYPFLEQTVRVARATATSPRAAKPLTFAEKANFDRQTMRFTF